MADPLPQPNWQRDSVVTTDGRIVPVRATARRPSWEQLPVSVRRLVAECAGSSVIRGESAGTGFTPGFASRLDLADGRAIFVKAASSADDARHGWPLSEAYREEIRKLSALPVGIGAPPLLWHRDVALDGDQWVVLALQYVDGTPPRRPWQAAQLQLVLDKLVATADALSTVPPSLGLRPVADELVSGYAERLTNIRELGVDTEWLDAVELLCSEAGERTAGTSIVHLDLRDDNVLIGTRGDVWFVDWNWPTKGAAWIDTVCLLLSARGDGIDVEAVLASFPLTREVDSRSINALLAVLWAFWGVAITQPVTASSPHLRDHQRWYADVTRRWLTDRLRAR